MSDLAAQRRFFAEEIQVAANLRTASIVDALASVPRERFLPPGPWTIRSETDLGSPPRETPAADPRFVYHNVSVAIDAERMLFNGAPGLVCMAIDALAPRPGERVLHIGAGTGYFTAIAAHCVGRRGRVVGVEIDPSLAARARENLSAMPWVDVRCGDAASPLGEPFDVILVNAGVTHPLPAWLDALAPAGRMALPLTVASPAMGNIGKGPLLRLTRTGDPTAFDVRPLTFVAIYSALGVRDDALNAEIGKALAIQPFPPIRRLRCDAHEPSPMCWLHAAACCWSLS